ncbi:6-pyruvoyl trahydropterin synthase family protein [Microbacterium sp. 2RAF4]|uniref:6-pyruvoyl trahydropterin synthase family protein n=1 Tax=Microbacterium sp. 2RAF4 TaxID=3232999 RepID=UPI003F9CDB6E
MKATISKDFDFAASHRLEGLREGHQCSRIHGHNYVVRVTVVGDVVEPGFVIDYGDFAPIKAWLDDTLDHRHLNDVIDMNPTAEHLAALLAETAYSVFADAGYRNVDAVTVSVSETPKTWASVTIPADAAQIAGGRT